MRGYGKKAGQLLQTNIEDESVNLSEITDIIPNPDFLLLDMEHGRTSIGERDGVGSPADVTKAHAPVVQATEKKTCYSSPVLKYLSALSGSTVATIMPGFILAICRAAKTLAPDDVPTRSE